MLFQFDSWLLEKIEKFSHGWQKTFGLDCLWLAKLCSGFVVVSFLGTYIGIIIYQRISSQENEIRKHRESGYVNPERIQNMHGRILLLCISTMALFAGILDYLTSSNQYKFLILVMASVCFTFMPMAFYFFACSPLPPAKSKVRKWLENTAEFLKGLAAPTPQPVPIRIPSR